MKTATVRLQSASAYSQSRAHTAPHLEKEGHDDYEQRTWREKLHYDPADGLVLIPQMSLKNCLAEAAAYLGLKISGKGNSKYRKHFEAGILVLNPIKLPIHKDSVEGEKFHCHANGQRGSGSRVWRTFPVIREWGGEVDYHILDETITKDAFETHIKEMGTFIGIGRFRPRNGGFYGRFNSELVSWK
jgi:hypothetical protein